MKVLLADKLPQTTMDALEHLGLDVDSQPGLSAETLPASIGDANVLIVRSTRVTAETVEAGKDLNLVIRAGAGTNTIDCDAAARQAVHVANCPGKNAVAVAELTMGLVLSLDRFIPDNVSSLRDGRWEKGRFSKGQGLLGRTIGVIGAGRIGQEVLTRARAFGMRCVAYDPFLTPERAAALDVGYAASVLDLCAQASVVTVHVPMTPETKHLIGAEAFAAMAPGTLFVHMARGGIVDDQALKAAVDSGRIRAASDVFEEEPKGSSADYEGAFRDADGFYGTHHIGASTIQAQEAIGDEVVRIISHWMSTGQVRNCVNRSDRSPASGQLLVRHLDRVGVLARVLDVLQEADISVKEMENAVFDDTGSAVAAITLDRSLNSETLDRIHKAPNVLGLLWIEGSGD